MLRARYAPRRVWLGFVLTFAWGSRLAASPVSITEWIGGSGDWNSQALWSAGVPMNGPHGNFHALVLAGRPILTTTTRTDQLTIGSAAAAEIGSGGRLELSTANHAENPAAGMVNAGGELHMLAGGTLAFDTSASNAYLSLSTQAYLTGGRIEASGAGTLVIESPNASSLVMDGPGAVIEGTGFVQNSGILTGNGVVRTAFTNAGHAVAENGVLRLEAGPAAVIFNGFLMGAAAGGTLVVDGSGGGSFFNTDTLTAAPGGVVELRNFGAGGGTAEGDGFINVGGTLRFAADLPEARFATLGLIRVDSGVVEFAGSAMHSLEGATVVLSNAVIRGETGSERIRLAVLASGSAEMREFSELTNAGWLHAEGAGIAITNTGGWFLNTGILSTSEGSSLTIASAAQWRNFDAATGTLTGGDYEVADNSTLMFAAGTPIALMKDARVRLKGPGALFTHDGVSQSLGALAGMERGGLYLEAGAGLTTGPLRLLDATLRVEGASRLDAAGLITLDGGEIWISRTGVLQADEFIQLAGETVVNGTLRANVTVEGGHYRGSGTTAGHLNVGRVGTLGAGGGHTVTGDARLAGRLLLAIAGFTRGLTYDTLDILGTAYLDGALHVLLDPGFDPGTLTHGRAFVLMTFAGRHGTFSTIILPDLESFTWRTVYTGTSLILEAVNPLIRHEVPEPGTVALAAAGIAILLAMGRWRRGPWENGVSPGRRSSPDARTNHRARRTAAQSSQY
ncbi:MAG: PEP-CTERM sorting domain-containing protein [Acidobacteria bacterium]|nr:PEP-CTERM sorting domain-containing protein [Acidobacteriota bacterium]